MASETYAEGDEKPAKRPPVGRSVLLADDDEEMPNLLGVITGEGEALGNGGIGDDPTTIFSAIGDKDDEAAQMLMMPSAPLIYGVDDYWNP